MIRTRRALGSIAGGILVIAIAAVSVKVISDKNYAKQIPALPDLQSLSESLKDQLSVTYRNAYQNPSAENIGMMGMVFNSSTYYDKAAICYELAIKRDNRTWKWSYYLGYLNQEMGETKAALRNYKAVTKINPGIYLAWYYLGACYQKLNLPDSSEYAFNNILKRMDRNTIVRSPTRYDYFPLVTYTRYCLARIYMNTKRMDLAEQTLRDIIDNQKAYGPAYRLLGNVYSQRGDTFLSNKYLARSNDLTVNPSPVDTLIDRLSLMSRSEMYLLKKIDEAEKNVFPEYAMHLVDHSLIYIHDNEYLIAKAIRLFLVRDMPKKAFPFLSQHLNYYHNDFDELKSVGDILYDKGFYFQALNYYSSALLLKPDDSQVISCVVISLAKAGEKQKALDMVNGMLEKNRSNSVVLADGVTLLLNLGEKEKAKTWLNKLKTNPPLSKKGLQLTGMLADQDGKWQEALIQYNLALRIDPSDMTTIRLLGNILIRQKMWEKAILHFRKSLEYHPNDPYLLERLGSLLVTCNDLKFRNIAEGKDFCERAFINTASHSVNLISAGRSLAIAYEELGDKQNATKIIKMTINIASGENVPSSYLDDLRNLLKQFSNSN